MWNGIGQGGQARAQSEGGTPIVQVVSWTEVAQGRGLTGMRLGGAAHDRWLRDCVMPHSSNPNVARAARRTAPIGPSPPNRGSWPRVGDQRGNEDRETGQREPGELGGGGGEDQCVATHEYSGGGGCGQEQGQVQDVHRVGGHVHGLAAPDPGAAIRSGMISHSHSSVKSVRRATSFDSCP